MRTNLKKTNTQAFKPSKLTFLTSSQLKFNKLFVFIDPNNRMVKVIIKIENKRRYLNVYCYLSVIDFVPNDAEKKLENIIIPLPKTSKFTFFLSLNK
jgi:cephalosporin hydroxylase